MRISPLLLAAAGLACGGDALAPVDGELEVVLTQSSVEPGAVVFLVQGPTIDSIEGNGHFTSSVPSGASARRVLIAGDGLRGRLALVHVPDAGVAYQVVVQEAADRASFALLDSGRVQLQLRRVYR